MCGRVIPSPSPYLHTPFYLFLFSGTGLGTHGEEAMTNSTTVNTAGPQKQRTKEHLEKRCGERNVDSRFQVQLEEDGGGSTGQSCK